MIITEKTFEKARKQIKLIRTKNPKENLIFTSDNDDLNRKIIEKENIDILLLNQKNRKDFQKQRNSGFNHVLAEIAKKNKIIIGINLDEIIETKTKEKSDILARVIQNIKICKKKKLNIIFIAQKTKNSRNIYDLNSLGLVLGMHTSMIKNL